MYGGVIAILFNDMSFGFDRNPVDISSNNCVQILCLCRMELLIKRALNNVVSLSISI